MTKYPYTIENGHGEWLTFTGVSHDPDGDRIGADAVAQPGAGPPMHVHYLQDEGVELPAFVQRVLIPIFYVLGRALGKYKKYADAPEPIAHA